MKILLIISSLFLGQLLYAAHIVGGDMYYDYLGGNSYRITIILFRDCASSGAPYDNPMPVSIFNSNYSRKQDLEINFPGSSTLPVVLNNPCVTAPSGICTERAIYTTTVNLPASTEGYYVSYQRCCRGANVSNMNGPDDTGLTLTVKIPGTNVNAVANNSPRFNNYPPLVICNNDILKFDHSAMDPDGDSLTYELVTPLAGGSSLDPQPNPIPSPPYSNIQWSGGYSATNPLGPGATISINSKTGMLTADPELLGLFVVGIRVKEYRNGIFIGQADRDFLFKVVNCVITLQAEITPQAEVSTFISVCQGFTVKFENKGYGGTNYSWDFGVNGINTDVSTSFSPTYTYPGPGIYDVMLVVNPGWPCTDTSYQTFEIYEKMTLSFTTVDSVCIQGNSLDFRGLYEGPSNPTITWDFGSSSNPPTGDSMDMQNVVFQNPGFSPVTITADNGTCHATYTDTIFLYDMPSIDFTVAQELRCAPYSAQFTDLSISYAPLNYFWEFGDNQNSNQKNPLHVYESDGNYDVSLTIEALEGCKVKLNLTKNDMIKIFPSPKSEFKSDKYHTDVFKPFFQLTDESSSDSKILYYFIDDTTIVEDRNPKLSFSESGSHVIEQTVINEYGCKDTSFLILSIDPFTTIYVPNTFTPDGNKFNNVFQPVIYDEIQYELTIYDRWGEIIFESKRVNDAWDGTFQGKPCAIGTYGYKISLVGFQDNNQQFSGFVNLIR